MYHISMIRQRLFSGIQPTNILHIGNYIGALKQWVDMQEKYDCMFCVVDLHAITVPQDPKELRQNILNTAATYLAVGLDPKLCSIYVQSEVPEHAELGWILSTITRLGELERMTQFKDKSKKRGEKVGVGLYSYPTLMAADILLYDTKTVPVGEDQMQHIELARTLARRFNSQFGETFVVPQALIQKVGARIMGLNDPKVKMSKSEAPANYIALTDEPDVIRKKIMRSVTDSGQEIKFDPGKKPAISNLITIYHHATEKSIKQIENDFQGKGYGDFKKAVADAVTEMLDPIRQDIQDYLKDPAELQKILDKGRDAAHDLACKKMCLVRKKVGLGRA